MASVTLSYYAGVRDGVGYGLSGRDSFTSSGTSAPRTTNPGANIVSVFADAAVNVAAKESPDATVTSASVQVPASTLVWLALPTAASQVDVVDA